MVGGTPCNVDPDHEVTGVGTLDQAGPDQASFLANMRYQGALASSRAAVVFVPESTTADVYGDRPVIVTADPYLAFARLQRHFYPQPTGSGERHASAVIAASARIADDADIGPQAVIGANAIIGPGSVIGPGVVVGDHVRIGASCLLHANVVVAHGCQLGDRVILQAGAVIGADGFGYAWSGSEHVKIPQTGRVVLEDDVEIGANSCIDRGALGDTIIRRGVKLDNLIQVGHNVEIGAYSIMASQVGISGSTRIGQGCQVGGQAGIAGHLKIGDGCKLAAKTGVMSDLEAGGMYGGMPAMPHRTWLKISALTERLPEIWKRVRSRD
jgi:UDP-3-O-[3-hydroxymyristoyl] glucosamine N-acyltransferase